VPAAAWGALRTQTRTTRPGLVLGLLAAAQFLVILDGSIVNMALPVMASDLGLAQGTLSWVVNAYALTFGGFLLVGGRLADRVGARTVLIGGLALISMASLVAGFANSGALLVAARSAQGLGAALLAPSALSLMGRHFAEGPARTRAFAVWGAVSIAGGPAGGVAGGMLAGSLGWSSVFLIGVPLGLAAAALAALALPISSPDPGARFNVVGAATATAGVSMFVLSMLPAGEAEPISSSSLATLAAAGVLLALFVRAERHGSWPLIPRAVRGAHLGTVGALGFVAGLQFLGAPFYLTLQLQHVYLYSPLEAGLAFLPWGGAAVLSSRAASAAILRFGATTTMVLGFGLLAAALASFARVDVDASYAGSMLPGLVLHAVGTGLVGVTLTVIALRGASSDSGGLLGGVLSSVQQIGGAVGLALVVSAYRLAADVPPGPSVDAVIGLRAAYLAAAALAIGGVIASVVIEPKLSHEKPEPFRDDLRCRKRPG
jgi:MFS family permease